MSAALAIDHGVEPRSCRRRFAGLAAVALLPVTLALPSGAAESTALQAGPACWDPQYSSATTNSPAVGPNTSLRTVMLSHLPGADRVIFEFNDPAAHPSAEIKVAAPSAFTGFSL